MTISLKAAADGLSGTIQIGGVDAANVTNNGINSVITKYRIEWK